MAKRLLTLLNIVFLSAMLSMPAHANYFYIGLATGNAEASDNSLFVDSQQSGHYLNVGLVSDYGLGIEIGYFSMVEKAEPSASPAIAKTSLTGQTTSLVANIPFQDIMIFASAGSFRWSIEEDDVEQFSGTSPTFSAGISWLFSNNWDLRLEYARYLDIGPNDTDISHARVGISYVFY